MTDRQQIPSPAPSLPRVAGLVVVDKPLGWTSHDVVSRMRRLAGTRKVGHAGTLDPAASGVLVVGVEKATKLLTYVTGTDKTYRASIRLGAATVTDDAEGDVTSTAAPERLGQSIETHLQRYFDLHGEDLPPPGLYDRILREVERPLIEIALDATGGNQLRCAELLGINRNTLRKKVNDLNIEVTRRRRLM